MPAVAMTPTWPERVAAVTATAPGRITPSTGTAAISRTRSSAWAVAVLQASRRSLTSWPRSHVARLRREATHLVAGPRAVRRPAVVAEVDEALLGESAAQLGEDGQAADARVEDRDGPGVAGAGHRRARAGLRSRSRAVIDSAIVRTPAEIGASGALVTKAMPSLFADATRRPSETIS